MGICCCKARTAAGAEPLLSGLKQQPTTPAIGADELSQRMAGQTAHHRAQVQVADNKKNIVGTIAIAAASTVDSDDDEDDEDEFFDALEPATATELAQMQTDDLLHAIDASTNANTAADNTDADAGVSAGAGEDAGAGASAETGVGTGPCVGADVGSDCTDLGPSPATGLATGPGGSSDHGEGGAANTAGQFANIPLPDGSPVPLTVMQGVTEEFARTSVPPPVTARFLAADKGDEQKATERWQSTLRWRHEEGVNSILRSTHRHFPIIKRHFQHFYHGRGRNGEPVYFERSGRVEMKALKAQGITLADLLRHYIFISEFLWTYLEPGESGRVISVLDVDGMGLSDVGGEVLEFIRGASGMCGRHYPERSQCIYVVNVPRWFNMAWRIVRPFLDPVTLEKVCIVRGAGKMRDALMERIAPSELPKEYGGESQHALGDSPQEQLLWHVYRNGCRGNGDGEDHS